MKVIDHEDQSWFLFEHDGTLLLDVNCSHSFVGYTYLIALNDDELAAYEKGGHEYLSALAHDVHYTAPIVEDSQSPFRGRDLSRQYSELTMEAVRQWRAELS
ncbi:hypothetical protein [Halomonas binhaiensis]|uniref:Uncharacterized protein n=1 Tax=Halomonas binhaiensis TaxID=2562282 RepID=A0A5C1NKJ5_9GAMM|nr:hypothetical protein [Halomonas binhaiensis]QEM82615.1 hypothetical protein E4T21_14460 [Halomonas binhaiensis]